MKLLTRRCILSLKAPCLIAAVLVGLLSPDRALAILGTCRDDPVVTLSNGAQIDLTTDIVDTVGDVHGVSYTLHAPAGTSVVALIRTGGLLGPKESFHFYADDAPGRYDTTTVVTTGKVVTATATTTVVSVLGLVLGSSSASGMSGVKLVVKIRPLL